MSDVPFSRELASVLGKLTAPDTEPVRLIVGKTLTVPANPTGYAYVDVEIEGQTFRVPRLWRGDVGPSGSPAYLLATKDFILFLGTVRLVP